jgi:hypothetical protein
VILSFDLTYLYSIPIGGTRRRFSLLFFVSCGLPMGGCLLVDVYGERLTSPISVSPLRMNWTAIAVSNSPIIRVRIRIPVSPRLGIVTRIVRSSGKQSRTTFFESVCTVSTTLASYTWTCVVSKLKYLMPRTSRNTR